MRPELLAPAGDWDALRAAVANGADAVYFGLSDFNARHRAANFTLEELPRLIAYLHGHNVRGYVTCNTLIFSDELPQIVEYITAISQAGADAVIVQDLGLVRLIRRLAPGLTVHGSTQMTLTEARGIEFVKELGVERVILARELALDEIRRIAGKTSVPLEVFVHGALCVAYSGQCLTSESLGGRSANRGQCAQACRLPYELIVDGEQKDLGDQAYLLSPQDLAAPDLIADLVKLGVACFKIEGRLKSAHYVAATTQTYRTALEAALQSEPLVLTRQQELDLAQSFSRGFTHGFLSGVNHQELVPGKFPKSRGVRLGTVAAKTDRGVVLELDLRFQAGGAASHSEIAEIVKPGDGVVFDEGHPEQDEQGGRLFGVRPHVPFAGRSGKDSARGSSPRAGADALPARWELTFGPGDVNLAAVSVGSTLWKTDDPAMRRRMEQSYSRDIVQHRSPLALVVRAVPGELLEVRLADEAGHEVQVTWEQPLQHAEKRPLSAELLREQFGRLGDTPFELGTVEIHGSEGILPVGVPAPVMVPKSVLNTLRREAIQKLLDLRSAATRAVAIDPVALDSLRAEIEAFRNPISNEENGGSFVPKMHVLVRSLEQLDAVLAWQPPAGLERPATLYCDFEEVRRYEQAVERCRTGGIPVGLATLRIIKPSEEGWLRQIADYGPDCVLVRNLAGLKYYHEKAPALTLVGDYSLNVANELTAGILAEQGLQRLVPSYDLNWQQLTAMLRRFPPDRFEAVVHQHMPMFHMEHCVFAATLSNGKDYRDCGRPCDRHRVELRDRVGENHPLLADVGCRNTVFNASAQSAAEYLPKMKELGLRHFRIELLREDPSEVAGLLDRYSRLLAGLEEGRTTWRQLRVLNQLGVTRGTLDFA
jgi:putative protease